MLYFCLYLYSDFVPMILAQSICTHYSCFENTGRFVTLKKNQVKNVGCKKQGAKNRVIIIQEEKRAAPIFLT